MSKLPLWLINRSAVRRWLAVQKKKKLTGAGLEALNLAVIRTLHRAAFHSRGFRTVRQEEIAYSLIKPTESP